MQYHLICFGINLQLIKLICESNYLLTKLLFSFTNCFV